MSRRLVLLCASLAIAAMALMAPGLASAQDRTPAQRQSLIDLAYVLGQSHALRQACAGQADQYWRGRMQSLIAAETPDADLAGRLKQAFNTGYASDQAAFPACNDQSLREQARVAAHGRTLATELSP